MKVIVKYGLYHEGKFIPGGSVADILESDAEALLSQDLASTLNIEPVIVVEEKETVDKKKK